MSQNRDLNANRDTFARRCDARCRYKKKSSVAATTGCHKSAPFDQTATSRKSGRKDDFWRQESLLGLYAFELAFFTMAVVKEERTLSYRPGRYDDFRRKESLLGL